MRSYARTHRPSGKWQASEAEVLAAIRAWTPRSVMHGYVALALPGPNVTDVARGCHRYAEAVRPTLTALVGRGVLKLVRVGSSRCYTLADTPMERSA
jgi:hypothetical protein